MLLSIRTSARSLTLVAAVFGVASLGLFAVRSLASDRVLTRAELASSFGGDGDGQCCFFNSACYFAGTYTQTRASDLKRQPIACGVGS